jgi:hypothetical protein
MPDLLIPATRHTPAVDFRFSAGQLSLSGESYPENTAKFYGPVMEALDAFLALPDGAPVSLKLALAYVNSGSLKMIYRLVGRLDAVAGRGRPVQVVIEREAGDDAAEEFADDLTADYGALKIELVDRASSLPA